MHYRALIRTRRTRRMRQMRIARSSKPRRLLAAIAPPAWMTRIAPIHSATAVMADATGAGTMIPGRLHRAGRMRGVTIVFMIPTAIAGTARTALRANNLTATPEAIRMTPLHAPTCRAPRCVAPSCGASGATRAIKEGRSLKTTIPISRSRQTVRGPSRFGAVAAFSAAAMSIRTTTKVRAQSDGASLDAICFYFLESTGRPGPARCERLRADGDPDRADSSARRRRP